MSETVTTFSPAQGTEPKLRLVVYDVAGDWQHLAAGLTAAAQAHGITLPDCIEVYADGPVPVTRALLVVLPMRGLDRDQAGVLEAAGSLDLAPRCVARVTAGDLSAVGREEVPFKSLARHVRAHLGLPDVVLLPDGEAGFFTELARQLRGLAGLCATEAEPLDEEGRQAFDVAWERLAKKTEKRCKVKSRRVKWHGDMAEDLVSGITEQLEELKSQLEQDWVDLPFPEFEEWKRYTLERLHHPGAVLPVVGLFSSGKTTLFNSILGARPDGNPPLRTSYGRNTALLCKFHPSPNEHSYVDFTWREHVSLELLWYRDPAQRPVESPVHGRIEQVLRMGVAEVLWLVSTSGERHGIPIPTGHKLAPGLKAGVAVEQGSLLTVPARQVDWRKEACRPMDQVPLKVRPQLIQDVFGFMERGLVGDAALQVVYRRPATLTTSRSKPRFLLESRQIHAHDPEFAALRAYLLKRAGGSIAEEIPIFEAPDGAVPLEVVFEARVRPPGGIQTQRRSLDTDADWNWFQGAPDQGRGKDHDPGFAESPETAYLIERADLYLSSLLFSLMSMVDTPGLNSVTRQHDRVTEEYLRQGDAFVLMAPVGRSSDDLHTQRLLALVSSALENKGIKGQAKADRIFIAMNWFKRKVGARTEADAKASVEAFRQVVCDVTGIEVPRLYVVNLDPRDPEAGEAEELLGSPSLMGMLDDLRGAIVKVGLEGRLIDIRGRLERTWRAKGKELKRQLEDLSGTDDGSRRKKAAQLLDAVQKGGCLRAELRTTVEEECKALLRPLREARRILGDMEDKGDFKAALRHAPARLEAYNELAERFAETLAADLQGRLSGKISEMLPGGAAISARPSWPDVPAVASFFLQRRLNSAIDDWPNFVVGFFKWVGGGFKSYEEQKRREILDACLPASKIKEVEHVVAVIRAGLLDEVDRACDRLSGKVHVLLDGFAASAEQRKLKREGVERGQEALTRFKPRYQAYLKALERAQDEIRGMQRRSKRSRK